ncbi:MAG: porin [Chitinophagaceae bacterium]|nr:porin [Oligoflexus sp.]
MNKVSLGLGVVCLGLLSAKGFAQEAPFNNLLLLSPQIISPSQTYQVTKAGRFEGYLGLLNGKIKPKGTANGGDTDVTGTDVGIDAYYAVNPMATVGVKLDYANGKASSLKNDSTEITPSVAVNLTEIFALGVSAHLVSGSADLPGGRNENTSFNYYTLGATMHQGLWEATLAFSSKNKDDNKPQNSIAQSWGLHGRYKLMPNLALGLSLYQKDNSALSSGTAHAKDETGFGLHLESQFTDVFAGEFAFLSSADVDGASGDNGAEFLALGSWKVTPNMNLGARLSYATTSSNIADTTALRAGVFVSTIF